MSETRSSEKYLVSAKLRESVLPTNKEVLQLYFFKRSFLQQTDAKFISKIPTFQDVKYDVAADVKTLWTKASSPILSKSRIQAKLRNIVQKFNATKKRASKSGKKNLREDWFSELFDISPCKCKSSANPLVLFWKGKYACKCPFQQRIHEKEFEFLKDQRSNRRMTITAEIDVAYQKQENALALKRKAVVNEQLKVKKRRRGRPRKDANKQPITTEKDGDVALVQATAKHMYEEFSGATENSSLMKTLGPAENVTKTKSKLADRRSTSLRQQADQLIPEGFKRTGTSQSSV